MHRLPHSLRLAAMVLGALVAVAFASGVQAAPAQADNCQAEELLTKQLFPSGHPLYESPAGDESSDPRCVVLKTAGCDNASTPGPCLAGIVTTANGTVIRVLCQVTGGPICYVGPGNP